MQEILLDGIKPPLNHLWVFALDRFNTINIVYIVGHCPCEAVFIPLNVYILPSLDLHGLQVLQY